MTEVEGPLGPLERFSSLPMRGRDDRVAVALGRSMLEVNCDMAHAFDIPWETRRRPLDALLPEPSWLPITPDRVFQPADPVRIDRLEYGSVPGLPQAYLCRLRQARYPTQRSLQVNQFRPV